YFGAPINDSNYEPIGDLGVIYVKSIQDYSITGQIGDDSPSHSERWALDLAGKSISSENYGQLDDFDVKLNGKEIFTVRLNHLGTHPDYSASVADESGETLYQDQSWTGYDDPDYDYTATIQPSGFILS